MYTGPMRGKYELVPKKFIGVDMLSYKPILNEIAYAYYMGAMSGMSGSDKENSMSSSVGSGMDHSDSVRSGMDGSGMDGSDMGGSGMNGSGIGGSGMEGSGMGGSGMEGSGMGGYGMGDYDMNGMGGDEPMFPYFCM